MQRRMESELTIITKAKGSAKGLCRRQGWFRRYQAEDGGDTRAFDSWAYISFAGKNSAGNCIYEKEGRQMKQAEYIRSQTISPCWAQIMILERPISERVTPKSSLKDKIKGEC